MKKKKKYDEAVREREKKMKGNYFTKHHPQVDNPPILLTNVMERDYRYWISDAEYCFLSCLCDIAYVLRKHRHPLTPDSISQEDREKILDKSGQLGDTVNIYFYMDIPQTTGKEIRRIAEHNLLYPQANRIHTSIQQLCSHFTQNEFFTDKVNKEILTQASKLLTETVDYIRNKLYPKIDSSKISEEEAKKYMQNILDEWWDSLSSKEKKKFQNSEK